MMRAGVVLNRRSSKTERSARRLPGLLAARGIVPDNVRVVTDEAELRAAVKRCVKNGAELVIVGGGDGSMTTAVDVLAHRDVALGVLPLGTGNSFAATLGIGDDLERAIDVIARGRTVRVDLGVVRGTHFANFATIGLPAEIAAAASHDLKRAIGPGAYVAGALGPFLRARPFTVRLRTGTGKSKRATQQIVIANGRFFGRRPLTPDASIVEGRLTYFSTTGVSRFAVLRTYAAFAFGLQTRLPDAVFFSAKKIEVTTSPKQPISLDGNAFGRTPAVFKVAPRALLVRVPSDFDAGE